MRMPGQIGHGEIQFRAECIRNLHPTIAERGKRAYCSAELEDERPPSGFLQPHRVAVHSVQPAGGLQAKCGGQCLLHPGARRDGSAAMFARQMGERGGKALGLFVNHVERAARLQDQAGVHGVLAGGAPVDKSHGLRVAFPHQRGELFDQRDGRIARDAAGASEFCGVEQFNAALRSNDLGRRPRNHAGARFGSGQCGFEIEHSLKARAVVEQRVHRFPSKEWIEQIHALSLITASKSAAIEESEEPEIGAAYRPGARKGAGRQERGNLRK
jgi:hypothetical protein